MVDKHSCALYCKINKSHQGSVKICISHGRERSRPSRDLFSCVHNKRNCYQKHVCPGLPHDDDSKLLDAEPGLQQNSSVRGVAVIVVKKNIIPLFKITPNWSCTCRREAKNHRNLFWPQQWSYFYQVSGIPGHRPCAACAEKHAS